MLLDIAKESIVPASILKLVQARDLARQNKEWEKADNLREQLQKAGYVVEDSFGKTRIKKSS